MQVGQNVEALLVGIANGWRPMLSIRMATPRPSGDGKTDVPKPAPAGGFDAREERDLRGELGDMPQVRAGATLLLPRLCGPRQSTLLSHSSTTAFSTAGDCSSLPR